MKLKTENYEKFSMRAVALIGLLISFSIVAIFFYDTGRLENEPYGHTKHYTAHTDKQIARICSFADTKVAAIECAIDQKTTKRDAKRAEQDLNAQQKMAAWAWWMTIVTGATAIVAGFGVFFVWNDTREARKIGQAQTRAYVNVLSVEIRGNKDRSKVKIVGTINNSGQTPARNLRMSYRASIDPPPFSEEWHCEPDEYTSVGFLAGQAQSFIEHFLVGGGVGNDLVAEYNKTFSEGYEIWFYGIILYDDVFGQSQQSRFRFQVDKSTIPAQFFPCETGNEFT